MADEPEAEDRIARVERKLDELLSAGHAKAEQHEEEHLGRPSDVQEMVRMELAAKEAADKQAVADAAKADEHKTLAQTVADLRAKMTEQKPEAPQPRRQRAMWGKR